MPAVRSPVFRSNDTPVSSRTASFHAYIPARPVVSSVPSMSQKRTIIGSLRRLRQRLADTAGQARHVETVIGEHLVVAAALRQLGDADACDACRRLETELGDGRGD